MKIVKLFGSAPILQTKNFIGWSCTRLFLKRKAGNQAIDVSRTMARYPTGNRILCVAEKNDAARSIAEIMSRGGYRRREGFSKYNKIYEFDYHMFNKQCSVTMTSVSGHLMNYAFTAAYKNWRGCNPVALFDATIHKVCPDDYKDIQRTLEREAGRHDVLVVWTDCDREGENIGFEIINVCLAVKRNLQVYRARFSEITPQSVSNACNNLVPPDELVSKAVDVRQELDLRIGAAFTRLQTLRLQKVFPDALENQLISFGSCQFPTLGFVVERYKQVEAFVSEVFYKIKVSHQTDEGMTEFNWKRQRLFNRLACEVLLQICLERPIAKVVEVRSKHKSKWRPQPMDTVELEKLSSRKLRISAKETMKIAEKLYTSGYISYPRTETTMFPKDLNLFNLVQEQTQDPNWGPFATGILQHGPSPRQGNKTDQAHPPIHPTKYAGNLQGNEQRVYELIVRHFLACCSKDAQGQETVVEIKIADEEFSAQGLTIIERNYLDVYPYDRWSTKVIPHYERGQEFEPTEIQMTDGETSPPPLLTEADLIALMEKHGIGTDATHAEHIETIKSRLYVGVRPDGRFVPGELGMGLVEGYDLMGYELSKPNLRAELEADLKSICDGSKCADDVLSEQVTKYKTVFIEAAVKANMLDQALAQYLGQPAQQYVEEAIQAAEVHPVRKCPHCKESMVLKTKKDGGYMISCMGFPACKAVVFFPSAVQKAEVMDEMCQKCQPAAVKKIKFKFKKGSVPPMIPLEYIGCIGGCDYDLKEALDLNLGYLRRNPSPSQNTSSDNTRARSSTGNGFASSRTSQSSRNNSGWTSNGQGGHSSSSSSFQGGGQGLNRGSVRSYSTSAQPARTPLAQFNQGLPNFSNNSNSGNAVVCNCGSDAVELTVRKEGPNKGRKFLKCQSGQCNFFLWSDQEPNQNSSNTNHSAATNQQGYGNGFRGGFGGFQSGNEGSGSGYDSVNDENGRNTNVWGEVLCQCNQAAVERTVQKEGPNKGRKFYVCGKPRDNQCKFFQWADEDPKQPSFGGGGGGGTWTGGGRRKSFDGGSRGWGSRGGGSGGGGRKRNPARCSLCGEQGHTRRTCPDK
ncbi:DNA topoisomerase 3-alpha [Holothuria leucospilota]|uniref:DNA topoisomerase n=1 Tax=Holothuria leucospilota TaxID=206669 RepID=A0A9Q1C352_HOLLE|nr:DNA topoisomerase 3-alpha [Holothuria leucospilota]